MFEWDNVKAESNKRKHKVDFAIIEDFEWALADIRIEFADNEERLIATGFVGSRLYVLVYVERGDKIRVISLRRATKQEAMRYEEGI